MSCDCKLYSFDIFDTLITRKVAKPTGIFVLMQDELKRNSDFSDFDSDIKENFFKYRTNAEYRQRRIAHLWRNHTDITLDMIYEDIKTTYCLTDEQCERLKSLEIQYELGNIIPIPENIERLKTFLNEGKRVVLISDMYLPESVIKQMLVKCDEVLPTVKLYLSSQLGFMKTTKELFKYVYEQEQVEYSDWVHIGDNKLADYENALSLGIRAELYHYIDLKGYEKNILNSDFHNPIVQLFVGCAKNIRLYNYNKSDKFHLGVSLAGVIFYPYISWLLDQCQKRGLNRLYFIARDGYILKNMADLLIKDKGLSIKTEYLYGSRKAWRVPALTLEADELYEQFVESGLWSYKKLDQVFELDKNVLKQLLPAKFASYSNGMKKKKVQNLKEFLLNDKTILLKIVENNKEKRNAAVNYLKQTIDYSDDKFAFVDLDGSGFTQNCLAELMKDFYPCPIKSFYFASTPAIFIPEKVERYPFYSLNRPNMGNILELLTKAPHGQTLGYKLENEKWMPVLENTNVESLLNWNLDEYNAGMYAFIKAFNQYEKLYPQYSFKSQLVLGKYINFIFSKVDKETANLLGSVVHSFYGKENNEFASPIGFVQAIKYLLTDKINTESVLYSKVRSHKWVRKILEYKKAHPDFRKEMLNVFIHRRRRQAYINFLGLRISFRHLLWKDVV